MNTSEHLQHLANLMRAKGLDALVCLELSERVTSQAIIWPVASDVDHAQRNQPTQGAASAALWTRALIVPSSLVAYDQARKILMDNPVYTEAGASCSLAIADVPLTEVTALFQAAQFKFRLVLAVDIRG
jgi:hypothetical protein